MYKLHLEKAEDSEINYQHPLDHRKSKGIPEKHLLLLHWLSQSLWLCGSKQAWKILKEMGISDHLTCFLRNLYSGQQLEPDLEKWTGSKLEKEYVKVYTVTLLI